MERNAKMEGKSYKSSHIAKIQAVKELIKRGEFKDIFVYKIRDNNFFYSFKKLKIKHDYEYGYPETKTINVYNWVKSKGEKK